MGITGREQRQSGRDACELAQVAERIGATVRRTVNVLPSLETGQKDVAHFQVTTVKTTTPRRALVL